MKKYVFKDIRHMLYGGDYNPDQWQHEPEVLKEDMRLFKLAHCNEMSLGIFAWAALEPTEGKFDFSFLDKAIDDVYHAGGRVILATPSGARPAWLATKYPEVLRTTERGEKRIFGRRHNHCFTSPVYREKVAIINRKLAERYKDHPAVIAWHISNEYGGECHCELCQAAFRNWLKEKYGTLENLNRNWWTSFWAHTYTSWEQIHSPSPLGVQIVHGLNIDWHRFVTHQTTDFMKAEIAALRQAGATQPATTNMMGFFKDLDYRVLAGELDFISNDLYPAWSGHEEEDIAIAAKTAMTHDLMRSLKHQPFIQMECTPSHVNWHPYNKLKRPGVNMLAGLQLIAHGADSVLYFQFRKGQGGYEKYHGAIVDHEGSENTRVFKEVAALGARLEKLSDIVGTTTKARVGLLFDWDNRWMLENACGFQNQDKKVMPTVQSFYRPLWQRGIDTDIISVEDNFEDYDVIIAPMLYSVPQPLGDKLERFVREGGRLLATYTTAMVNESDLCYRGGFPGAGLRKVFGIWNEEIDTLYPEDRNSVHFEGKDYTTLDYCEIIHSEGAAVLATYNEDFYKGCPAATCNHYGKGQAYYIAFRDEGDFADELIGKILKEAAIRSAFDGALPHGVTAHSRTDGENEYVFVENHSHKTHTLATAHTWVDAENGSPVSGSLTLAPLETRILKSK